MAGKMRKNEAGSSSGGSNRGESEVVDVGRRRSSCGYCRSGTRSSISHGLWAHSITVDDYQDLLDRGWRRSGSFLYKPEMERTCCPSYTIRLRAADFVPNKEQLRVSRRMQRFQDGTLDMKNPNEFIDEPNTPKGSCSFAHGEVSSSAAKKSLAGNNEEKNKAEQVMHHLSDQIDNAVRVCTGSGVFPFNIQFPKASVKKVSQAKRKLLVEGSENLLYTSNIAFQIAAALRHSQSDEKDINQSRMLRHGTEESGLSPKTIAEKLASSLTQIAETSGLSIKACNGHINYYSATKQASLDDGVQINPPSEKSPTGCGSKGSCLKKSCERPQGKRRRLEIRLKRSSYDPEEYALYKRYQIKVHNDTPDHVTESSYRRFLVDTPLVFVRSTGDGTVPPCGFGSFHQQYVIDGQLVAVGVIDILPKCLSSKYLFWDPDFAFLSLGKYSALQEIGWVKENQGHCSSLQYYYLGYYIHSCSKMRYKAAYYPSELLCPLRYQWVPFDIAKPLLDRKPYVVLSDFTESSLPHSENLLEPQHDDLVQEDLNNNLFYDEEMIEPDLEDSDDESDPETGSVIETEDGDVSNILIGLKGSRLRYKDLRGAFHPNERSYLESQLHRYTRVVGAELSERIIYSIG
ncbi:hypothetical protein L1049_011703 [Liquidambar formosana]|uniref:Arginyl-tRNA--protein transferase n=1 Tax=Liquidambar formosana TaxID=63359 RepID=A0AAP0RXP5_LIQFO